MNLQLDLKTKGNFDTHLYNLLMLVPENLYHNYEHRLSTPKTIYSRAKDRVLVAFEEILSLLERVKNKEDVDKKDINKCHKELIDSLMAFTDDGFNVLKCFIPKQEEKIESKFANKWLEAIEPSIIKKCSKNVYKYRKRIGLIDNKIKHEHGRYNEIEIEFSYYKVLGYYIDSVNEDGVVLPDKSIHPDYCGKRTAISYNEDIRELIINMYFIAYQFSQTLINILKKRNGISFNYQKCISYDNNRILKIFTRISRLDEAFFEDEYFNLPQIIIKDNVIELREKAYNSYVNKLIKPLNYKISTGVMIEDKGIIGLPYMGHEEN